MRFQYVQRRYFHLIMFFTAWLVGANPAMAENAPFGECRAGYWSSNRNLDDKDGNAKVTCFVNWRPVLSEGVGGVRLGLNARAGARDGGGGTETGRLREGFLEAESGSWSWRAGRQIIAWGRADRINPTDNLSPRDFTLLVPDDDEQRNGINAALLRYQAANLFSITGIVLQFEPNRLPQGSLPANLIRAERPTHPEFAVKLDRAAGGADWSISYYDGYERTPRYHVNFISLAAFVFKGTYEHARTLGADVALAQGAWTMRGELSVTRLQQNCTGGFSPPFSPTSCEQNQRKLTRAVLGADRDFWGTANLNVQIFNTAHDYRDPESVAAAQRPLLLALNRLNSEFASREWGMTLRISDRFLNDRLKLELAAISDFTNRSTVLRPRASYAFNDSVKMSVGADHFQGGVQTFFGTRKKNNTAYMELDLLF